jgi:Ion channel
MPRDHANEVLLQNMSARENQKMHQQRESPLLPFWVEDRGLSFFLAFLVLVTIFVPMITLSRYGRIGLGLMFALMLLSGAVASIRTRILMYLIIALTVVEFAADLIVEFNPSFRHLGWDTALKICGLTILVVMTLKQTFRPGPVSAHRVMGGVAGYLLIGLIWAFGYKLLMELLPGAIHFQTFIGGIPTAEPSRLIYFSFSTLTSVGYGDAYPVHRIARSLATAEALIGQLYPAILIATLVGLSLQTRTNDGGPNGRRERAHHIGS